MNPPTLAEPRMLQKVSSHAIIGIPTSNFGNMANPVSREVGRSHPNVRTEYARKHLYNMGEVVPIRPMSSNSLIFLCMVCVQNSAGTENVLVCMDYVEECIRKFREFCLLMDKPGHLRSDMFGAEKEPMVIEAIEKHFPSCTIWNR